MRSPGRSTGARTRGRARVSLTVTAVAASKLTFTATGPPARTYLRTAGTAPGGVDSAGAGGVAAVPVIGTATGVGPRVHAGTAGSAATPPGDGAATVVGPRVYPVPPAGLPPLQKPGPLAASLPGMGPWGLPPAPGSPGGSGSPGVTTSVSHPCDPCATTPALGGLAADVDAGVAMAIAAIVAMVRGASTIPVRRPRPRRPNVLPTCAS